MLASTVEEKLSARRGASCHIVVRRSASYWGQTPPRAGGSFRYRPPPNDAERRTTLWHNAPRRWGDERASPISPLFRVGHSSPYDAERRTTMWHDAPRRIRDKHPGEQEVVSATALPPTTRSVVPHSSHDAPRRDTMCHDAERREGCVPPLRGRFRNRAPERRFTRWLFACLAQRGQVPLLAGCLL